MWSEHCVMFSDGVVVLLELIVAVVVESTVNDSSVVDSVHTPVTISVILHTKMNMRILSRQLLNR